jgi:hypothetical protein
MPIAIEVGGHPFFNINAVRRLRHSQLDIDDISFRVVGDPQCECPLLWSFISHCYGNNDTFVHLIDIGDTKPPIRNLLLSVDASVDTRRDAVGIRPRLCNVFFAQLPKS